MAARTIREVVNESVTIDHNAGRQGVWFGATFIAVESSASERDLRDKLRWELEKLLREFR